MLPECVYSVVIVFGNCQQNAGKYFLNLKVRA